MTVRSSALFSRPFVIRVLVFMLILWPIWTSPVEARRRHGSSGTKRKGKLLAQRESSSGPLSIDLIHFDLVSGQAQVLVKGMSRTPEARLFILIEDRGRRFIPSEVDCQNADGGWHCALVIPRIYQRTMIVGLALETRGKIVEVGGDKVRLAWASARAQTPLPKPAFPQPPRRAKDDSSPPLQDEIDSDSDE